MSGTESLGTGKIMELNDFLKARPWCWQQYAL